MVVRCAVVFVHEKEEMSDDHATPRKKILGGYGTGGFFVVVARGMTPIE